MDVDLTLVTGATGFVGSAVARALAARGHRLRLLVRPTSDRRNLAGLDAELVDGDLTDPASLARAADGLPRSSSMSPPTTASGCPTPTRCCAPMSRAPWR